MCVAVAYAYVGVATSNWQTHSLVSFGHFVLFGTIARCVQRGDLVYHFASPKCVSRAERNTREITKRAATFYH